LCVGDATAENIFFIAKMKCFRIFKKTLFLL